MEILFYIGNRIKWVFMNEHNLFITCRKNTQAVKMLSFYNRDRIAMDRYLVGSNNMFYPTRKVKLILCLHNLFRPSFFSHIHLLSAYKLSVWKYEWVLCICCPFFTSCASIKYICKVGDPNSVVYIIWNQFILLN